MFALLLLLLLCRPPVSRLRRQIQLPCL